jgi:hypothetical protein
MGNAKYIGRIGALAPPPRRRRYRLFSHVHNNIVVRARRTSPSTALLISRQVAAQYYVEPCGGPLTPMVKSQDPERRARQVEPGALE